MRSQIFPFGFNIFHTTDIRMWGPQAPSHLDLMDLPCSKLQLWSAEAKALDLVSKLGQVGVRTGQVGPGRVPRHSTRAGFPGRAACYQL